MQYHVIEESEGLNTSTLSLFQPIKNIESQHLHPYTVKEEVFEAADQIIDGFIESGEVFAILITQLALSGVTIYSPMHLHKDIDEWRLEIDYQRSFFTSFDWVAPVKSNPLYAGTVYFVQLEEA